MREGIVYIAKLDIFGHDLNVYHIDRTIRETKRVVYSGYEEVYVNAVCSNTSNDVGQLMQVFTVDGAYNEKFPVTSILKNRLKNTKDGVKDMSSVIERFYSDELREAKIDERNKLSSLYNKLIRENKNDDIKMMLEDYIDKRF